MSKLIKGWLSATVFSSLVPHGRKINGLSKPQSMLNPRHNTYPICAASSGSPSFWESVFRLWRLQADAAPLATESSTSIAGGARLQSQIRICLLSRPAGLSLISRFYVVYVQLAEMALASRAKARLTDSFGATYRPV